MIAVFDSYELAHSDPHPDPLPGGEGGAARQIYSFSIFPSELGPHRVVRERFLESRRQPGQVSFCHVGAARLKPSNKPRLRNLGLWAKICRFARDDAVQGARDQGSIIEFAFTFVNCYKISRRDAPRNDIQDNSHCQVFTPVQQSLPMGQNVRQLL